MTPRRVPCFPARLRGARSSRLPSSLVASSSFVSPDGSAPLRLAGGPDTALEPGEGDGGGEAQSQWQGRVGGLEAGGEKARREGGCGSVVRSRPWACTGRGVQLGLLEGGGNRQEPPPARRPDD